MYATEEVLSVLLSQVTPARHTSHQTEDTGFCMYIFFDNSGHT